MNKWPANNDDGARESPLKHAPQLHAAWTIGNASTVNIQTKQVRRVDDDLPCFPTLCHRACDSEIAWSPCDWKICTPRHTLCSRQVGGSANRQCAFVSQCMGACAVQAMKSTGVMTNRFSRTSRRRSNTLKAKPEAKSHIPTTARSSAVWTSGMNSSPVLERGHTSCRDGCLLPAELTCFFFNGVSLGLFSFFLS